jgi:inner membrane protein
MIKKTHIALGIVSILPLIGHVNLLYIPFGLIGAVFPDYDYKVGLKHRGITHTLLALIVSSAAMLIVSPQLALIWGISYSTHLAGDSITKMGIPALYPLNKKYYGLKLIKTKGAEDLLILLLCIYIISEFIAS